MPNTQTETLHEFQSLQESLKEDFCNFVFMLWDEIPTHDVPGWVQYKVAEELQRGDLDRFQIQGMRGLGKSYICIAYVLWRLYQDPYTKILVLSCSAAKAEDFVRQVRSLIDTVPCLQSLKPRDGQTSKVNKFNVGSIEGDPKVCSVTAYGITGQITGDHVDLIICDDIETKENCMTLARRQRILDKLTELECILNPGGQIIFLGTPHTDDSIYLSLKAQGYPIIKFPVHFVDPETNTDPDIHHSILDAVKDGYHVVGDVVYHEYYTQEDLDARRLRMGATEWRRQFELRTNVDDDQRRPLKLKDLMVLDQILPNHAPAFLVWSSDKQYCIDDLEVPTHAGDYFVRPWKVSDDFFPYEKRMMFIDPAGNGPDDCAWCVGLGLNGFVYIPEMGSTNKSLWDDETLDKIAECAWKWRITRILCEPNYGGGGLTVTLRQAVMEYWRKARESNMWKEDEIPPIPKIDDSTWARGQKEPRIIQTAEPIVQQHRVVISRAVARNMKFGYQYTHLTEEKGCLEHEDVVEAFSGVLSDFIRDIDRSPEISAEMKKRQQLLNRIKGWGSRDARFANKMTGDKQPRLWRR